MFCLMRKLAGSPTCHCVGKRISKQKLLQFRLFRFALLEDRNVAVGVFRGVEKILITLQDLLARFEDTRPTWIYVASCGGYVL